MLNARPIASPGLHRWVRWSVTAVAAATLTACGGMGLSPAYERPALVLPSTDSTSAALNDGTYNTSAPMPMTTAPVAWLTWWQAFDDPVLNALLQEAADHNQDIAIATSRVAQAQATVRLNQSSLYPSLDLQAGGTRKGTSDNAPNIPAGSKNVSTDLQLGLSASYEIDFWGKFAQADTAARARLISQAADLGTVQTTLYANVAQSYFGLRALDAQQALAASTLATRQDNLRLQQLRFDAGVIGELDLRQADAEVASAQVLTQQTQQSLRNAQTTLALLLGRQPADIMDAKLARGSSMETLVQRPTVPAQLPSDILATRPDLVSAERALVAANADIGVARSAYFPKLSLTVSVGQQSKELSSLLDPASMFWNLVSNLTQPIFRGGAIDANVAAANARQKQAVAQYTLAVQNAFKDVHTALNNVQASRAIAATTAQRIAALNETLRLATLRYNNGYSSYLEVLNAQRDVSQAEMTLIDAQRNQLNATVSLYQAVGGGWDTTAIAPSP